MPLNGNVLVAEADVASAVGATLNTQTMIYTVFGLQMSQAAFQSVINSSVGEEIAILGPGLYASTDSTTIGVIKEYQVVDCAYDILSSLPGLAATYFNFRTGDRSFELQIGFIHEQAERFRVERDRLINLCQNITPMDTTTDAVQPGYSSPPASVY